MMLDASAHLLCQTQGTVFERACRAQYDMVLFVSAFMRSRIAAGVDEVFNRYQWAGEAYWLEDVAACHGLVPRQAPLGATLRTYDPEALYWMGYTYRLWHYYTGEASAALYALFDFEVLYAAYPGYHTLSCELAIDRLKETWILRGRDPGRIDHDDGYLARFQEKVSHLRSITPPGHPLPSPYPFDPAWTRPAPNAS